MRREREKKKKRAKPRKGDWRRQGGWGSGGGGSWSGRGGDKKGARFRDNHKVWERRGYVGGDPREA